MAVGSRDTGNPRKVLIFRWKFGGASGSGFVVNVGYAACGSNCGISGMESDTVLESVVSRWSRVV